MKVRIRIQFRLPGVGSLLLLNGSAAAICLLSSVALRSATVERPPLITAIRPLQPSDVLAVAWRAPPAATPKAKRKRKCDVLTDSELSAILDAAGERHGINTGIIREIIATESHGYPCSISPSGAAGLMQLMPSTARTFQVGNVMDPEQSVEAGTKLLKYLLEKYDNDLSLALAAYNAGPGNVDRYGGIPPFPETQRYVRNIMVRLGKHEAKQ